MMIGEPTEWNFACRCGRVFSVPDGADVKTVRACSECYRHINEFLEEGRARYQDAMAKGYIVGRYDCLEPPQ